jgi:hypothetical protein
MGFLRKIGKKIKRGFKKLGKALKKGFGKVAKAFGKLGPLGSIALSFLLPGIGNMLTGWLGHMGKFGKFIMNVGSKIKQGATWIKEGVGTVFNKVTDAIEFGMNKISQPFMKEGARGMGSAFRDFVSDATGGFIDKSTVNLKDAQGNLITDANPFTKDGMLKDIDTGTEFKTKVGFDDPTSENFGDFGSRVAKDETGLAELSKVQEQTKLINQRDAFLEKNMKEITVEIGQTPEVSSGEVLVGSGKDGNYQVWKDEKSYKQWTSGKFDVKTKMDDFIKQAKLPVEDTSYSVFDGRQDDQSFREYISDSKEASTYKKVGALSTYGMTQMNEEAQILAYNTRLKKDKADYFTTAGLDNLMNRTNYTVTQPANFIDTTTFDIGKDLNNQFLASMNIQVPNISGFDVGGYGTTYEDVIELMAVR